MHAVDDSLYEAALNKSPLHLQRHPGHGREHQAGSRAGDPAPDRAASPVENV